MLTTDVMKARPKYHFLTVVSSGTGRHVVSLPYQTFGSKDVPWGILVKDRKGKTIVTKARRKTSEGDILFTTTLRQAGGCLIADDIHLLKESDNVFHADVMDCYKKYMESLPKTKPVIEDWWRHCGAYDRQQASGIPYDEDLADYLVQTDRWWDTLSTEKKRGVYEEFFEE